jgi:hypothetical protein
LKFGIFGATSPTGGTYVLFLKNCKKMVKSAENRRESRKTMTIEQEQKNRNCRSMVVFFFGYFVRSPLVAGSGNYRSRMRNVAITRPTTGGRAFPLPTPLFHFLLFYIFFWLKLMKRILFKENSKRKSDRFQRKAASFVIKLILKLNLFVKLFVVRLISFLFI